MCSSASTRDLAMMATSVSNTVRGTGRRYQVRLARLGSRLVLGARVALDEGAARVLAAMDQGRVQPAGRPIEGDTLRILQDRQRDLVGELQHRTFNLMCLVRSIADMTVRSSNDLADFDAKFSLRLDVLARAQRLLSRVGQNDCVRFGELIRGELDAVGALGGADARVTLDGPSDVTLRSGSVQILAMALHELAKDALQFGALHHPGGQVLVRWIVETDEGRQRWLVVDWREAGVTMSPCHPALRRTSEGCALIEGALPYQLRARTRYDVVAGGLHCSIALPITDSD